MPAATSRRYERGQHRMKHVGRLAEPEIVASANGERVGKCPTPFPAERRQALLDQAIPHIVQPPYSPEFPKRLYAVDRDGTIYEGQTSNPGDSYHGYPYAGRMGRRLVAALRAIAIQAGCETEFDRWVKKYIIIGGPPDL